MRTITLLIVIYTSLLLVLEAVEAKSYFSSRKLAFQPRTRSCLVAQEDPITLTTLEVLRGGATKKTTEEDEDTDDEDNETDDEEGDVESDVEEEEEEDDEEVEEDEYDADEYDDEYDEEEEEEEATSVTIADKGEIVEPNFVSPQLQLYSLLGSMMIAKKIDLFNPMVVKAIRFLFILQLIVQQAFIFYVRIMAKKNNDRTPIQQKNPLSEILQKQMGQAGGNDMVKNLASSFLSSASTVMEYDMKQVSNMQGGILVTMVFNWFLHFKLKKTQPLLTQIMSSTLQLIYHPLFQVYILGRNLERPFKTQMMMTADKLKEGGAEEGKTANDEEEEDEDETDEEEEDDDDDEVEEDDDDDDDVEDDEEEDDEVTQSTDEDDSDDEEDEDSSSS